MYFFVVSIAAASVLRVECPIVLIFILWLLRRCVQISSTAIHSSKSRGCLQVMVPSFVIVGSDIVVDTRDGSFVRRA